MMFLRLISGAFGGPTAIPCCACTTWLMKSSTSPRCSRNGQGPTRSSGASPRSCRKGTSRCEREHESLTPTRKQAVMAGRILNRRELRKHVDQAEQIGAVAADTTPAVAPPGKKARAKAPAAPKVKRPRAKKAPPRMFARWGVFDAAMKQVAVFAYNQRAAADAKLEDLLAKKKGIHFLQIVKE